MIVNVKYDFLNIETGEPLRHKENNVFIDTMGREQKCEEVLVLDKPFIDKVVLDFTSRKKQYCPECGGFLKYISELNKTVCNTCEFEESEVM